MKPTVPRKRDCLICFSNIEDNVTFTKLNWKKALKNCKTYLATSVIIKCLKNKTHPPCCSYCYESVCQLTTLEEQVKKLKKEISDFSLLFSKTVLERRSLVENEKDRNPSKLPPQLETKVTLPKTTKDPPSVAVLENVIVKKEVVENMSNELPSDSEMNTENDDLGTDSWFDTDEHENVTHSDEEIDVKYSCDLKMSTTNGHGDPKPKTTNLKDLLKCVKMPIIQLERLMPVKCRNSPKIAAGAEEETTKCEKDKLDEIKPYKCSICKQNFSQMLDLQDHNKLHNQKRPHACSFCDKSFLKPSLLKIHRRIHKGERPYKCSVCSEAFRGAHNLKVHQRKIHSEETPHKCSICSKSFRGAKNLKVHERKIHSIEKLHKCSICSKSFERSSNLKEHKAIHLGERPYKCSFCEKSFKRANTLKEHEAIHSGKKPHKCSFCTKVFLKPSMLKVHERVHTGERPFICSFCAKSFISASLLNKHEKCHSEEKPYQCSSCSKSFRRSSHLKTHQKTHSHAETVLVPQLLPNIPE